MTIKNAKRVHFVGIGGIGMSALARMLLHRGVTVSGSDASPSALTKTLEAEGMDVIYKQDDDYITSDIDVIIYTDAMRQDSPELIRAKELSVPTKSYFEALGEIATDYKVIAVAGTHGKTTTTAMTANALISAGIDPTVIVGSLVNFVDAESDTSTNFRAGSSEYLLVEACEYKRHFLHLQPYILAVTNIELDHPDYYKDLADVEDAFAELASKSEIVIADDTMQKYVLQVPELKAPGEYNIQNAALALAICDEVGADLQIAKRALEEFGGTWRRFDYKGKTKKGAQVYDDYAHHPTAIRAMLKALNDRKNMGSKIIVVFESHTYTRTFKLMDDFATSFEYADEVIIAPIYAAREEPIDGVNAQVLASKIAKNRDKRNTVRYTNTLEEAVQIANELGKEGDVIVFMGAGDIYRLVPSIIQK